MVNLSKRAPVWCIEKTAVSDRGCFVAERRALNDSYTLVSR